MNILWMLLALAGLAWAIGFVRCVPLAYRWCIAGYDYHGQNLTYNGTAALGFGVIWPLFLYFRKRYSDPS